MSLIERALISYRLDISSAKYLFAGAARIASKDPTYT